MELSSILGKVRALVERAEHPNTPREEADTARDMADKLMEKYAIEEWQAMQKSQASLRPGRVKVNIGEGGSWFLQETATLTNTVARYCRCSSIWMTGSGAHTNDGQEYCWVYGYESDLRYFDLLFTTLYLHMSGAIFPRPDSSRSLGVNAYELHNAGLNWFDIAQVYGWYETMRTDGDPRHMYRNKETGERASWGRTVGRIKSAYTAEVKARGEAPLRIPPQGSLNFRRNAAAGYLSRIYQRLQEQAGRRGAGTEIVLADRSQNIAAAIAEDFSRLSTTGAGNSGRFNAEAYNRGSRHANTASLAPEATAASNKAIK